MNRTRIVNLLRAYFIENKKMLLICCIITFGVNVIRYANRGMPEFSPLIPYIIMLWLAGTFFQPLLKKNNSLHAFNLPVTASERLIHAIVIILTFGIVIHLLTLAGAYIGYYGIHPLLNTNMNDLRLIINGSPSIWEQSMLSWDMLLLYFTAVSAFLFGSIYFKKNAFWLTIVSGIIFLFGVALYNILLLYIVFGTTNMDFHLNLFILHVSFWETVIFYIVSAVAIVFFWVVSYFRLKETEV